MTTQAHAQLMLRSFSVHCRGRQLLNSGRVRFCRRFLIKWAQSSASLAGNVGGKTLNRLPSLDASQGESGRRTSSRQAFSAVSLLLCSASSGLLHCLTYPAAIERLNACCSQNGERMRSTSACVDKAWTEDGVRLGMTSRDVSLRKDAHLPPPPSQGWYDSPWLCSIYPKQPPHWPGRRLDT